MVKAKNGSGNISGLVGSSRRFQAITGGLGTKSGLVPKPHALTRCDAPKNARGHWEHHPGWLALDGLVSPGSPVCWLQSEGGTRKARSTRHIHTHHASSHF